jgi:hypothetical protein
MFSSIFLSDTHNISLQSKQLWKYVGTTTT